MKIILKSALVVKSAVFVTSHIQGIITNYPIKAREFLLRLKQDYFQPAICNNIRSNCLEKSTVGLSSLRNSNS